MQDDDDSSDEEPVFSSEEIARVGRQVAAGILDELAGRSKELVLPSHLVVNLNFTFVRKQEVIMVQEVKNEFKTDVHDGGTVGTVMQGEIHHIGRIEANIGKLRNEKKEDIASALEKLKQAISESKEVDSEEKRKSLLKTLDGVSEAAAQPPEQRSSMLEYAIQGLATACQAIGDIATVWPSVEGAIKSFFGFQS